MLTIQPLRDDSSRECRHYVPAPRWVGPGASEPCGARAVVLLHGRGGRCASHIPTLAVVSTTTATS